MQAITKLEQLSARSAPLIAQPVSRMQHAKHAHPSDIIRHLALALLASIKMTMAIAWVVAYIAKHAVDQMNVILASIQGSRQEKTASVTQPEHTWKILQTYSVLSVPVRQSLHTALTVTIRFAKHASPTELITTEPNCVSAMLDLLTEMVLAQLVLKAAKNAMALFVSHALMEPIETRTINANANQELSKFQKF